jgi:hypothetical protein
MSQRQSQKFSAARLLIGMAVLVLLQTEARGRDEAELRHRFLTEASQRWQAYLRFACRLQVSTTARNGRWRSELKQTDGATLRLWESEDDECEVKGVNPSYSFTLRRANPKADWRLEQFQMREGINAPRDREKMRDEVLHDVCNCLTLWNLWLPSLVQDSDFKIKSVRPYPEEKGEWVRVEFEYPKRWEEYPVKGGWRIPSGWMALDPEHDWILREFAVNYKATRAGRERLVAYKKYDIREGTDRHPIITRTTFRLSGIDEDGKPLEKVGESQIQAVERAAVPLSEFTLSAFGLPEPPGVKWEKPTPVYVWILAAAGASGALAFGAHYLARRRQAATAGGKQ